MLYSIFVLFTRMGLHAYEALQVPGPKIFTPQVLNIAQTASILIYLEYSSGNI